MTSARLALPKPDFTHLAALTYDTHTTANFGRLQFAMALRRDSVRDYGAGDAIFVVTLGAKQAV